MTRSEIKADLEAGTQLAAKKAKVPELTQDELDHLLDIYASAARFTAVDIGDEVDPLQRRHRYQAHRQPRAGPAELRDAARRRHGRALAGRLLLQGDQGQRGPRRPDHEDRPEPAHQPGAVRRHARPGALLEAGRPHPQLVGAHALGQDRRSPRGPARGHGHAGRGHQLRRRPHGRGRHRRHRLWTPPGRPATPTSSPASPPAACFARSTRGWASRSAWPPSSCSACTVS